MCYARTGSLREEKIQTTPTNQDLGTSLGSLQKFLRAPTSFGHLAALTRSHLIGDHLSGLTKEQTTCTMDPSA